MEAACIATNSAHAIFGLLKRHMKIGESEMESGSSLDPITEESRILEKSLGYSA